MEDIKISFELNNQIISDIIDISGAVISLGQTLKKDFTIYHNSNYAIRDCGFYISPYAKTYKGTKNNVFDYEKVLWFGNSFQELDSNLDPYGFFIEQEYVTHGIIADFDFTKIKDLKRNEDKNIFYNDSERSCFIEIITGVCSGEKQKVLSFNPETKEIFLDSGFSGIKKNDEYKITVKTKNLIKNKSGSSEDYLIPLLSNGGIIERAKSAKFTLSARLPENLREPGVHYFDLNFKYIPEE